MVRCDSQFSRSDIFELTLLFNDVDNSRMNRPDGIVLNRVDEIADLVGGRKEFMRICNVKQASVSMWKSDANGLGLIPEKHWRSLFVAITARGKAVPVWFFDVDESAAA